MALQNIAITHFRNLISAKLTSLSPHFNLIYGHNGSGKTSLLEAIYYLSLGRSFRTSLSERIIHFDADKLSLFAEIHQPTFQIQNLGLERNTEGQLKLRLNGEDLNSIAELAQVLPLQLIDSHVHALLDGSPGVRRKYLDWCIFYDHSEYFRVWKQFIRALKQRNAALRGNLPKMELISWTNELVRSGLLIDQLRREYTQLLIPIIKKMAEELLISFDFNISYYAGWDIQIDYAKILDLNYEKDRQFGHTLAGPHKADIKITINQIPAKDILSRGQQKLFVCAMIMARGALVQGRTSKQLFYLVDDLPSELDNVSRSRLIAQLSKQNAQVFITATDKNSLSSCLEEYPMKMFHVEHGKVAET